MIIVECRALNAQENNRIFDAKGSGDKMGEGFTR